MLSDKDTRSRKRIRRLWHKPQNPYIPIGCPKCPEFALCGGLRTEEQIFNCLSFCCGNASSCSLVCRNNPDIALRLREVNGWELNNVPRAEPLGSPEIPPVVQVIYNGGGLRRHITAPIICLPLYRMLQRDGEPRFHSGEALREAFNLASETRVVLTGVAQDSSLERWWGIGTAARIKIIASLRVCGVEMVTTPNFTLFGNKPRWHDFHAMKRIAIAHQEFLGEGMPAALHVNARTDADFERWTAYIAERPEVKDIAFEFTTGTRIQERRVQYVAWLHELARNVGRPLNLILRGGSETTADLSNAYRRITILDTNAFMKTRKRQRATMDSSGRLKWKQTRTKDGESLDGLLANNINVATLAMHQRLVATDNR